MPCLMNQLNLSAANNFTEPCSHQPWKCYGSNWDESVHTGRRVMFHWIPHPAVARVKRDAASREDSHYGNREFANRRKKGRKSQSCDPLPVCSWMPSALAIVISSMCSMCVCVCVSPNRLPLRGMAMKDPRVPPMTLCGRRRGGFLKEPVYWCRKECMLWDVGGRPFLMKGSETQQKSNQDI